MAQRDIADRAQAAQNPSDTEKGAVFIKNNLNEVVKLPDGTEFRFPRSRIVVTDAKTAEGLRKVAEKHGIFEE